MRASLSVVFLSLLLAGCDLFGGGETLRITYSVNATGLNGPVDLTYDTADGPVQVEEASLPFSQEVQVNGPRFGSVYLLYAETTCTGACTLTVETEAAVRGTPFVAEDVARHTGTETRVVATSASIVYR